MSAPNDCGWCGEPAIGRKTTVNGHAIFCPHDNPAAQTALRLAGPVSSGNGGPLRTPTASAHARANLLGLRVKRPTWEPTSPT